MFSCTVYRQSRLNTQLEARPLHSKPLVAHWTQTFIINLCVASNVTVPELWVTLQINTYAEGNAIVNYSQGRVRRPQASSCVYLTGH